MIYNPAQLATWAEARELAAKINQEAAKPGGLPMGGGVKPETTDPKTSGIYTPEWLGGPGQFPEPAEDIGNDRAYFLHFRFNNGAEGLNVGLIRDHFKRRGTLAFINGEVELGKNDG